SASGLQRFEAVFTQFFNEYDQYRIDSAQWDMRYGERYGASQPGYVAVHSLGSPIVASTLAGPTTVGEVVDPDTGARIPIINVPESTLSTPIVQPVPEGQR
ncbi:MAG: hypothetical protein ABIT16_02495, partial [Croceibacterium sp.]